MRLDAPDQGETGEDASTDLSQKTKEESMRRTATLATAVCALVALSGLGLVTQLGPSGAAAPKTSSSVPCGTLPVSATHYSHVIWVWMENHSYNTIIGSSKAPYINSLANECGLATNYHNISHPSLPNYVAATSGLPYSGIKQFKSDCNPSPQCSTSAASIFGQGESWKGYEENMPSKCALVNSGEYAVRHNPPPYFTSLLECSTFDVPYTKLASDLSGGTLPAFSFVTPNLIDDMHDGTIADGDTWLSNNLPAIFSSSEYQSGSVAVFVTWDEGEGGSSNKCATNTTDVGCHVATIVVSPSTVPGTKSSKLFNHYSLLGTAEKLLMLPKLGQAATSKNMANAFNL
jgi:phosphatidylinositol-3-phosphatase